MKSIRWLVIASFVLSLAGAVWMFVGLGRELKTVRPAEAMGPLRLGDDAELSEKIDAYLNKIIRSKNPTYVCAHALFGRDNLFAYVDRACGEFERVAGGGVILKKGFRDMARIELDHMSQPIGIAQPEDGEDHQAALTKLFPPEIRALDVRVDLAETSVDPRQQGLFEAALKKQDALTPH